MAQAPNLFDFDQPGSQEPEAPEAARLPRGFEGFEREDEPWLRLSFAGLSARHLRPALARWKTPRALLEAADRGRHDDLLATRGISAAMIERLAQAASMSISPALRAIDEHQIWLLRLGDALYPPALRAVEDAPIFLWVRGTLAPQDEIAIGIVGTRDVTEYGKGMAGKLARDLAARGVTVVSGLAIGIDAAAHRGALEGGGRTLACCGCGLDIEYPRPNLGLMQEIIANGAMISEFAPTMKAQGWHFPARNRIISGLSAGVVVVEAAQKSGALITADFAKEQGREVFAVPGNVLKAQSRGPHQLIRDGATLIEKAQDIVDALKARSLPFERDSKFTRAAAEDQQNREEAREQVLAAAPEAPAVPPPAPERELEEERGRASSVERPQRAARAAGISVQEASPRPRQASANEVRADLSAEENRVLGALSFEARHIDSVALEAGMGAGQAAATLLMLELKRLARRLPGGMFERLE